MNQSSNLAVNTLLTDQVRQVAGTACEPIDAWLEAHRQELVGVRRHLHMHPEPSGRERETTSYLAQRLDEVGVTATVLRDGLGLVADAVIGDPGPDAARVALRADIDALKIQDAKSVEYRSRCDGVMHACGHDVHSSIVMGIARAVAGQADRTPLEPGCGMHLRYLFQPAEEICQGARWLVEQGVLEGVDAILGLHVDPENPAGQFGVRYGPLTAVCHEVAISVRGQGGHAARPHQSRDPLAAAISLASTLYSQLPRGVDSRQPSVFSIGRISGGTLSNVIPDEVEILGSLRTVELGDDTVLQEKIQGIAAGVALSTETEIEVVFRASLEAVRNDTGVTSAIEAAAVSVAGEEAVRRIEQPSMGGEDFSVYQQHVPGSMFRLGSGTQPRHLLHTPGFDIDEDCLVAGARVMIRAALLWGLSGENGLAETRVAIDDEGTGAGG